MKPPPRFAMPEPAWTQAIAYPFAGRPPRQRHQSHSYTNTPTETLRQKHCARRRVPARVPKTITCQVIVLALGRFYVGGMTTLSVGPMVKEWRGRRRLSQLDLAHEAGVSPKHLSFVENGRSRPSPELLLTLARHLDVPLRERNDLLLAAGYAPQFAETELTDPVMNQVSATLATLLERHDPYPGVVLDRSWNVIMANRAASLLVTLLPESLLGPTLNIFRISLHPEGLAAYTRNFDRWAGYLLDQLRRLVSITADPTLVALEEEVYGYPGIAELAESNARSGNDGSALVLACEMTVNGLDLSLLTTLTTFGSPLDITLDEMMVELFYPADDATDDALRFMVDQATGTALAIP